MRKLLAVVVVVIVVAIAVGGWYFTRGPDLSQYEPLVEPRITTMPDQTVIQVAATGDPNEIGSEAFGLLMSTYFGLEGAPKGPGQPAPRARWPVDVDEPATEWVGLYAMPVPSSVEELPEVDAAKESGLSAELTTWPYGEVAEILHKGPYEDETATIERLKAFITDSGYEIAGLHEEEYLRGPGMLLPVDPNDYYTIIRYQVRTTE
jgi:effector-binding domain-containing protein